MITAQGPKSKALSTPRTMRFGSTAKVLLKCKLKYYRISECHGDAGHCSKAWSIPWAVSNASPAGSRLGFLQTCDGLHGRCGAALRQMEAAFKPRRTLSVLPVICTPHKRLFQMSCCLRPGQVMLMLLWTGRTSQDQLHEASNVCVAFCECS